MKTLIENTIEIYGIGHPETKTVFNIKNEGERNHVRFKPLTVISERKLTIWFKYTENEKEYSDNILLTIIKSNDENEIKEFILNEINNKLNPNNN
jgi:hypothetical protein